jgi:hypothetical protein
LLLAYGLLSVFFAGERLLRRGADDQTLETTAADRGSTRLIGIAYGAALNAGWVAPLLSKLGLGPVSDARVQPVGVVLMVSGLVVKAWAMRTLGSFYMRAPHFIRSAGDRFRPVSIDTPPRLFGRISAVDRVRPRASQLARHDGHCHGDGSRVCSPHPVRGTNARHQLGESYAAYQRRTSLLLPGVR